MRRLLLLAALLVAGPVSAQTAITIPPNQFGLPAITLSGAGSSITPPSAGFPASTCAAPAIYLQTAPTNGIAFTATPSVIICVNGTAILTSTSTAVTLASGVALAFGDSTSMSQGAANRVDLASGDSFYVVSGGLGVGVTPGAAGTIKASDWVAATSFYLNAAATTSLMRSTVNGKATFLTNNETSGTLSEQFTDNPTCATNCGTSPTLTGVDSSFTLTMGATGVPASGFIVTFNSTWAAAPQCTAVMGKAGMLVTALPMIIVTTTTTATVTTNGTAPANGDVYHFRCSLGQ